MPLFFFFRKIHSPYNEGLKDLSNKLKGEEHEHQKFL